jgi:hypothetical protein
MADVSCPFAYLCLVQAGSVLTILPSTAFTICDVAGEPGHGLESNLHKHIELYKIGEIFQDQEFCSQVAKSYEYHLAHFLPLACEIPAQALADSEIGDDALSETYTKTDGDTASEDEASVAGYVSGDDVSSEDHLVTEDDTDSESIDQPEHGAEADDIAKSEDDVTSNGGNSEDGSATTSKPSTLECINQDFETAVQHAWSQDKGSKTCQQIVFDFFWATRFSPLTWDNLLADLGNHSEGDLTEPGKAIKQRLVRAFFFGHRSRFAHDLGSKVGKERSNPFEQLRKREVLVCDICGIRKRADEDWLRYSYVPASMEVSGIDGRRLKPRVRCWDCIPEWPLNDTGALRLAHDAEEESYTQSQIGDEVDGARFHTTDDEEGESEYRSQTPGEEDIEAQSQFTNEEEDESRSQNPVDDEEDGSQTHTIDDEENDEAQSQPASDVGISTPSQTNSDESNGSWDVLRTSSPLEGYKLCGGVR